MLQSNSPSFGGFVPPKPQKCPRYDHSWPRGPGRIVAEGERCLNCGMTVTEVFYSSAQGCPGRTGISVTPPAPSSTMENETDEPKLPKIAYTILRNQWKRDGYDATGFSDRDIDGLVAGAVDHAEHSPFVAGRLGDGSILRWIEAHKELLKIIFQLGKLILPLLLL